MGLLAAGLTDIGQKRKTNQDSIYMNMGKKLFIVADGMGGHNGGDMASALAVKVIPDEFLKEGDSSPLATTTKAIKEAHQVILKTGRADPKLKGMGTTTVMLHFKGDTLYVGNVGDSRAYLFNHGHLYQLTRDHSLVQEKIHLGIYSREEASKDPMKNVLVRTVGYEERVDVDVFSYKVSRNDLFFICSDGLYGRVSDADIAFMIKSHIPDPAQTTPEQVKRTVEDLVRQANIHGGDDNISLIMVVAQ